MVKNLPANAGDTGSLPGPGRSPMWGGGQLSLCTDNLCSTREATAVTSLRTSPRSGSHLENACMRQQRPSAAKNK